MSNFVTMQCLRPFPGGHTLPSGKRAYTFMPNDKGHYVAEVHPDDVFAIKSISAAYVEYQDPDRAPDTEEVAEVVRTAQDAAGTIVETSNAYLTPATTPPKKSARKNVTDQKKRREREGSSLAVKAADKVHA